MIDTQAIRSKILDLALRGKLTAQLPEDGSAEDLYRQIHAKKSALIKEGKIKKEKQLPEIAPDEVQFEIPSSWKWVRMGCLLRVISGVSYEKADVAASGMRILRGGNIQNMGIVLDSSDVFLPRAYRDEDKIVQKGDVVIVASTGSETAIGRAGYVDKDYESTMIGAFLRICRPIDAKISMYLRTIFMGDYYRQHIRHEIRGMNINNVKEKYITHFIVPLPPLAEQQRIVEKIEQTFSILDNIDALQSQYADNLTVLKTKLIDAAIQGKLTAQLPEDGTAEDLYRQIQSQKQTLIQAGKLKKEKPLAIITADEIPFEIPKNWKWVRLASICSIINGDRGKNYPAKSTLKHEGIPFISALNLNGVSVTQDEHLLCLDNRQYELLGNGKLQKDDIVICIRGSLGKHGRYPFDKGAIASSLVICRLPYSKEIMGDYVMIWLDSSAFPAEIKRYDSGTAQPNLAANSLEQFLIPLPPLAEQKRIAAKLEELLLLCMRTSCSGRI